MHTSRILYYFSRDIFFENYISLQEQFYIMKPKEVTTRSFKLYLTTDQAAKYMCAGIINYLVYMAFLVVTVITVVNVKAQFM